MGDQYKIKIFIVILQSNHNELLEIKPLVIYSHSICLIGWFGLVYGV